MTLVVSVALATHNGSHFVAEQIRSILAQTRPIDELVVSDDASGDDTLAIIEGIVAEQARDTGHHVRLTILRNTRPLGVTANFEQALRAATGDLVALADQDDVWHPDRVAEAEAVFLARPGIVLVASDARLVDADGNPLGRTVLEILGVGRDELARLGGELMFAELLKRNLLTGATMMVRRELVRRAVPFPASWVHDEWLAMIASLSAGVAVIDRPLIDYRQHGANQIGAERVGIRTRLARLAEPRTERNARLLARVADLVDRAPALRPEVSGPARVRLADKLAHERARSAYPRRRLARVGPVWREWLTGRYRSYGRGAQDVLRDVVQPV